ncbi:unnamed protein product [Enterobius vermicularis]|uniref:Uncharacterized protein n=1 Tax=Enterobius vermicularis TaxID=51028 RepID=A0A0N4USR0_ENTVE|nr:unnamed protein product [Enterobius vermicularis]
MRDAITCENFKMLLRLVTFRSIVTNRTVTCHTRKMKPGTFSAYSNGGSSPPSQSSNSSVASPHLLYNSVDLCAVGALNAQSLLQQQQQRREKRATGLLLSNESLNSPAAAGTAGTCAYPAWSSAYTTYGINSNNEAQSHYQSLAQAFHSQDHYQSRTFVPLFSNFGQACSGAVLQDVPPLNVDDLSDPLKLRTDQIDFDPYHLMKSIWSDLDGEKTAGSVDSVTAVATA